MFESPMNVVVKPLQAYESTSFRHCVTSDCSIFLFSAGLHRIAAYSSFTSESTAQNQSQSPRPNVTFGQPTHQTHPHLVKPGELLPGIRLEEFKERRTKLVERILSDEYVANNPGTHVVLIPSSTTVHMSDKIPYVFRQNTDFLYFTGCQEPDSLLMLAVNGESFVSTLFVRKKDARSELWDGPRTGVDAAAGMFDVDRALPVSEFDNFFISHMTEHKGSHVWYDNTSNVQLELHKKLSHLMKVVDSQTFVSPKRIFHEIRLIKSRAEIDLMRKSCEIASAAIARTIETSKPNITEHQIFATVDYECRMRGAEFLAYPPVVAGGANANVIHYITNNQVVQAGDMVLMDAGLFEFSNFPIYFLHRKIFSFNVYLSFFAGCEYHGYSSDITRTWPIDGTFTSQQRILYEIVLDVQKRLTERLAELPTLDKVFHDMCIMLGQRLQEIGLIPASLTGDKLLSAAYTYCPHHVSHYLGMDVHDTGTIPRTIAIKPGMIVTMEPGIGPLSLYVYCTYNHMHIINIIICIL